MKSFCPRKTQKTRKILNNFLCVTTHILLNRKADFEMSKASFGLQKAWLSEFKAGFEPYDAKLHFYGVRIPVSTELRGYHCVAFI